MMLPEGTMDEAHLQALYERLLNHDQTAVVDLLEHVGPVLTRQLAGRYRVDETLVADAVYDTIISLWRRPNQYSPTRGMLSAYLRMSAEGDLKNLIEQEQRRRPPNVVSLDVVEDARPDRNTPLAEQLVDPTVDPESWLEEVDPVLITTILEELPDESDRRILDLMANGVRATSDFAQVLGISEAPAAEQQRQVKRAKDRVIVRIRRALRRKGWTRGR